MIRMSRFCSLSNNYPIIVQCYILEVEHCSGGSMADVLRILRQTPGCQLPPSAKLNLVRAARNLHGPVH